MFTNWANYLLGTQQAVEQEAGDGSVDASPRLRAVNTDDDWVLVDNSIDGDDDDLSEADLDESVFERIPPLEFTSLSSLRPYYSLSRASSFSSLPCLSLEESWFLTPPPCFTSEGPVYMETSPLENLLIEHPSMSVYQHSSSSPPHPPPRARLDSTGDSETERRPIRAKRVNGVPAHHQQEKQCIQLRSAQKIRIHLSSQALKRGALERNNKARDVAANRNERQRQTYRRQQPVNNRKCC